MFVAAIIYSAILVVYLQYGESVLVTTSLVIVTFIAGGSILYIEEKRVIR